MIKRAIPIALTIAATLLSIVGCTSSPEPLQTEPDFLGFITGIESTQIAVESQAHKIVDRYVVSINNETVIFKEEGEKLRQVSTAAFRTKQWVRIWFSGPVTESWPKLATARQIVIEETTSIDATPEPAPPEPVDEPNAVQ